MGIKGGEGLKMESMDIGEYDFNKTNGGKPVVLEESLYGKPLDITKFFKNETIEVLDFPPHYPEIDTASIDPEILASTFPKEGEGCLDLNEFMRKIEKKY
ncbi:hypothetical protein A9Q91_02450 [Candidatus Gracilibacteria bacterium 28_42_T64]|nr:hypothetical protein A9Q91_02450 [Candidatus Gracilibacteria bacterium 28_42_T64]